MIIDSEGNIVSPPSTPWPPTPWPPTPWAVKITWAVSFLALIVGVAAAAAFALWIGLILVPLGILASGLASIYYRLRLARVRRDARVMVLRDLDGSPFS
jgi:hypothetical protein